ncbi:MAG: hypothetical protein J6N21_14595 [Butyrivibrio sp.]|nr:hypothetical protein [Butyrivibrio sp.]MBP3198215.1 hypothetical protein [Butyrivibrio sp.]
MSEEFQEKLLKLEKKQLFYHRISAVCFAGFLLLSIVTVGILVPKITTTLENINSVTQKVETSLGNIDDMATGITDATANLNKLVNDNATELTDAVEKLSQIDYEGLNQAIQDLEDTVGPFASFMNRFK